LAIGKEIGYSLMLLCYLICNQSRKAPIERFVCAQGRSRNDVSASKYLGFDSLMRTYIYV